MYLPIIISLQYSLSLSLSLSMAHHSNEPHVGHMRRVCSWTYFIYLFFFELDFLSNYTLRNYIISHNFESIYKYWRHYFDNFHHLSWLPAIETRMGWRWEKKNMVSLWNVQLMDTQRISENECDCHCIRFGNGELIFVLSDYLYCFWFFLVFAFFVFPFKAITNYRTTLPILVYFAFRFFLLFVPHIQHLQ